MTERSDALFDIDRTAYNGFLAFELIRKQIEDGLLDPQVHEDILTMRNAYEEGSLDYESMVADVLSTWAEGLTVASVDAIADHTVAYLEDEGNKFYPYVVQVMEQVKDSHDVYFVTGEPQFVADATTSHYAAQGYLSTEFGAEEGKYTGHVTSILSHGPHKLQAIGSLLSQHDSERSIAFGDSEGDIDMLQSTAYAVCINPTPRLAEIAQSEGWHVSDASSEDVLSFIREKL